MLQHRWSTDQNHGCQNKDSGFHQLNLRGGSFGKSVYSLVITAKNKASVPITNGYGCLSLSFIFFGIKTCLTERHFC